MTFRDNLKHCVIHELNIVEHDHDKEHDAAEA